VSDVTALIESQAERCITGLINARYVAVFAFAPLCGCTFACSARTRTLRDRSQASRCRRRTSLPPVVTACPGSLRILVREHRSHCPNHRRRGQVLRRDQLKGRVFPLDSCSMSLKSSGSSVSLRVIAAPDESKASPVIATATGSGEVHPPHFPEHVALCGLFCYQVQPAREEGQVKAA